MKKILILVATYFAALFSTAQNSIYTQTVKGIVIDEQSGNILSNATVMLETAGSAIAAVSDLSGSFRLANVPVGRQSFRISLIGYEDVTISGIEVTSSKEVVLEIKLKERIKKLDEVIITSGRPKNKPLNEAAVVSARQFSVDEAIRYSGSRNDPSRMAQNFAGVSGSNDARNDIIIRGNSPAGVLWRMEGIDIPNPNHYSTLGSTGGPVTIINTNNLKNSDFITSAFPAQYGNALAGVFDLRLRNGNSQEYEFLGQVGFNGFEFGAEGPISKKAKSSFLINYRYSLIAAVQPLGVSVGTGAATPYYQDLNFKLRFPTKKAGTFELFGLGGESHIKFSALDEDNLYATNDGSLRDRKFKSLTGVTGLVHTYFFNPSTSGRAIVSVSGVLSDYKEQFIDNTKPQPTAFDKVNTQVKYSIGYTFNKKINSKNQVTAGFIADENRLKLRQDYIPDGDSVLTRFTDTKTNALLVRTFGNFAHRFNDKLTMNTGVYAQLFTVNDSWSIEPRWNIKYQFKPNQSISFGTGLHSQQQPLEVYFYKTKGSAGEDMLTNKQLDFVKSLHSVLGYDISFSRQLRFKAEVYGQYIYNAAVEKTASSFSMLNSGADFYFPDKTNLVNNGKGYNYGVEFTVERFLHKGFYYLTTISVFESKYKGSDDVWRKTAFSSGFAANVLGGKEFKISKKATMGIDTKIAWAGGQRYTPFDKTASNAAGYVVFKENEAYSLKNKDYLRWDLKFSYTRNGKKTTQKWYIDLQNFTNRENVYLRTLNPKTGIVGEINQIGFFPNINYMITF
jgi:Carboxypeptidase regulatory-like domain